MCCLLPRLYVVCPAFALAWLSRRTFLVHAIWRYRRCSSCQRAVTVNNTTHHHHHHPHHHIILLSSWLSLSFSNVYFKYSYYVMLLLYYYHHDSHYHYHSVIFTIMILIPISLPCYFFFLVSCSTILPIVNFLSTPTVVIISNQSSSNLKQSSCKYHANIKQILCIWVYEFLMK